jgi:hypothetical protein
VDVNGNTCEKLIKYNDMCDLHYKINYELKQYEGWESANKFHQENVYTGEHWEKCDKDGPIPIYHYISKQRLGSRSVKELSKWDYDHEIWLGDKLWSYCGPYWEGKAKTEYPKDFVEKLQLKALVK